MDVSGEFSWGDQEVVLDGEKPGTPVRARGRSKIKRCPTPGPRPSRSAGLELPQHHFKKKVSEGITFNVLVPSLDETARSVSQQASRASGKSKDPPKDKVSSSQHVILTTSSTKQMAAQPPEKFTTPVVPKAKKRHHRPPTPGPPFVYQPMDSDTDDCQTPQLEQIPLRALRAAGLRTYSRSRDQKKQNTPPASGGVLEDSTGLVVEMQPVQLTLPQLLAAEKPKLVSTDSASRPPGVGEAQTFDFLGMYSSSRGSRCQKGQDSQECSQSKWGAGEDVSSVPKSVAEPSKPVVTKQTETLFKKSHQIKERMLSLKKDKRDTKQTNEKPLSRSKKINTEVTFTQKTSNGEAVKQPFTVPEMTPQEKNKRKFLSKTTSQQLSHNKKKSSEEPHSTVSYSLEKLTTQIKVQDTAPNSKKSSSWKSAGQAVIPAPQEKSKQLVKSRHAAAMVSPADRNEAKEVHVVMVLDSPQPATSKNPKKTPATERGRAKSPRVLGPELLMPREMKSNKKSLYLRKPTLPKKHARSSIHPAISEESSDSLTVGFKSATPRSVSTALLPGTPGKRRLYNPTADAEESADVTHDGVKPLETSTTSTNTRTLHPAHPKLNSSDLRADNEHEEDEIEDLDGGWLNKPARLDKSYSKKSNSTNLNVKKTDSAVNKKTALTSKEIPAKSAKALHPKEQKISHWAEIKETDSQTSPARRKSPPRQRTSSAKLQAEALSRLEEMSSEWDNLPELITEPTICPPSLTRPQTPYFLKVASMEPYLGAEQLSSPIIKPKQKSVRVERELPEISAEDEPVGEEPSLYAETTIPPRAPSQATRPKQKSSAKSVTTSVVESYSNRKEGQSVKPAPAVSDIQPPQADAKGTTNPLNDQYEHPVNNENKITAEINASKSVNEPSANSAINFTAFKNKAPTTISTIKKLTNSVQKKKILDKNKNKCSRKIPETDDVVQQPLGDVEKKAGKTSCIPAVKPRPGGRQPSKKTQEVSQMRGVSTSPTTSYSPDLMVATSGCAPLPPGEPSCEEEPAVLSDTGTPSVKAPFTIVPETPCCREEAVVLCDLGTPSVKAPSNIIPETPSPSSSSDIIEQTPEEIITTPSTGKDVYIPIRCAQATQNVEKIQLSNDQSTSERPLNQQGMNKRSATTPPAVSSEESSSYSPWPPRDKVANSGEQSFTTQQSKQHKRKISESSEEDYVENKQEKAPKKKTGKERSMESGSHDQEQPVIKGIRQEEEEVGHKKRLAKERPEVSESSDEDQQITKGEESKSKPPRRREFLHNLEEPVEQPSSSHERPQKQHKQSMTKIKQQSISVEHHHSSFSQTLQYWEEKQPMKKRANLDHEEHPTAVKRIRTTQEDRQLSFSMKFKSTTVVDIEDCKVPKVGKKRGQVSPPESPIKNDEPRELKGDLNNIPVADKNEQDASEKDDDLQPNAEHLAKQMMARAKSHDEDAAERYFQQLVETLHQWSTDCTRETLLARRQLLNSVLEKLRAEIELSTGRQERLKQLIVKQRQVVSGLRQVRDDLREQVNGRYTSVQSVQKKLTGVVSNDDEAKVQEEVKRQEQRLDQQVQQIREERDRQDSASSDWRSLAKCVVM